MKNIKVQRLRAVMIFRNKTIVQLAKEINYSVRYSSLVLSGNVRMTDTFFNSVCRVLDVNPEWIEHGTVAGVKLDLMKMVGGFNG